MASKRRKRVKRVQRVKDSFLTLWEAAALTRKARKILELLGAGNPASQVANAVGCSRSNVSYWKDKFIDMGALRLQTRDVVKIYRLTPYGSRILTTSESGLPPELVCLEDHAIKFKVLEWEKRRLEWRRLGRPRNWEKLGVKIGNVRVVRTSKSIIIHPGRLRGFDVDELLVLSGRIVERVKMILENRFGMVFGVGIPLHDPVTRFYSEEAKELVRKFGTTIVEAVGSIDCSPPEKVPHEEYRGRDLGKARLMMPLHVRRLADRVSGVEEKVDKLSGEVHELVSVLKEVFQAPANGRPSLSEKEVRYIS